MAINLTRDAQRLLGAYQQIADLTPQQEQALQKAAEGKPEICAKDIEGLLDAGCLKQAHNLIKCDPRGDDPIFDTAIIGRPKVIKENVQVRRQHRVMNHRPRDPYYAKLEIDPRAQMVTLTSTSKFEPGADRPRPRLMKIVARTEGLDGAPTEKDWKNLEKLIADSNLSKLVWDPKGDNRPVQELDIHWIGAKTASVETKDVNEPEFDFGSGMLAISTSKDGGELSRAIAIDPVNIQRTQVYWARGNTNEPDLSRPVGEPQDRSANDTTPPETFDHKIGVDIRAKDLPRGTWIDTPGVGEKLDVDLRLGTRWLMEAGAKGSVSLMGQKLETKVREDDVYFSGSHSGVVSCPVAENWSIANVLGQNIRKDFGRVKTDSKAENIRVQGQVFQRHEGVKIAGKYIEGGPQSYTYADGQLPGMNVRKRPIQDAEKNGLAFDIELGADFAQNDKGGSLKGFTIDLGFWTQNADGEREWCAASHAKGNGLFNLGAKGCGQDAKFTLNFDDFPAARVSGEDVQAIVRDDKGIPVARVQIPLDAVQWA